MYISDTQDIGYVTSMGVATHRLRNVALES